MRVAAMERCDARTPVWSAPPLLFLLIALASAISFWIVTVRVTPDKSPDALVLFRQTGDPDYLPQVAGAADLKFGEISVKDYAGAGVRSFPYVPVIIHAIFYRFGGSVGFILADIMIVVLYACLLRLYLLVAGVDCTPADLLSLAVISGTALWVVSKAGAIIHRQVPVKFWEFRFPRPSVTEAVFVLFLILATMLVARPERSAGFFALFGISFAAILQSDIYQAFNAAFILSAVSIIVLLTNRDRWAAAQRLSATATALAVASLPFVYQQLHTSPDVKRRWGLFSTDQYRALLPSHWTMACAAMVITAAVVLARLYRGRDSKRVRLAALTVSSLGVVASVASGPASVAALHQAIQIYHFQDRTERMIGYALLLYAGWLLTDLREAFTVRRLAKKPWSTMTVAAGALCVAFFLVTAYRSSVQRSTSNFPTAPSMAPLNLVHYRTDFRDLDRVLGSPEYADAVMGTFDTQLADWWQYRHRYLYLADLFNTTLRDNEVESRVYQFLRMLGTSTEDFGHLLDNWYFVLRVLGCAKYQANSLFTPWPLSDYSVASQRRIALTRDAWNIEMPESEKARHMTAYQRTSEAQQSANALDIIVLDKDTLRGCVHPEQVRRFDLVWSNDTFEVWVPNNRGIANQRSRKLAAQSVELPRN